jgi:hypothetical protein
VGREFRDRLASGASIRPAGRARKQPGRLLRRGYTPKHKLELFDAAFYLTGARQNPDIRFFVAYVALDASDPSCDLYPRIFYKDVSLIWRSASHYVRTDRENWIGKGELREELQNGISMEVSAEETTDLPYELQTALETLVRRSKRIPRDDDAVSLILRGGPANRLDPYRDFVAPRRRARSNPRNLVNRGRPIARIARRNDPDSLRFVKGFEPDFEGGVIERGTLGSRLYGGKLGRFRILSRNRRIQYLFFAGPRHVWIIPPQATTTELSSYGLRTIDVIADEDLCCPGFEYHFMDDSEDPPVQVSQIPEGFAGEPSEVDPSRADASAWLDRLPVVREFRRKVLRPTNSRRIS